MKKPSGKLSSVTLAKKKIESWLEHEITPWDLIREEFKRFTRLLAELESEWSGIVPDNDEESQELASWAAVHINDKIEFKRKMQSLLEELEVQPNDSASMVSRTSNCSKTSSVTSARVLTEVRRKDLELQRIHLKHLRKLEEEKLRADEKAKSLAQRYEDLQLELEIEREKVKENALRELEESGSSLAPPDNDNNDCKAAKTEAFHKASPELDQVGESRNSKTEKPNLEEVLEKVMAVQLESTLPKRELQPFSGKLTEYQVFIRSFRYLIEQKTKNEEDRLQYLLQYTKDEPRHLISSCVHLSPEQGYKEARKLLEREYGSAHGIAAAYRKEMSDFPPFKEDPDKIKEYALLLAKCGMGMKSMKGVLTLDDPELILRLVFKLPLPCQRKWRQKVQDIEDRGERAANFDDFSTFVHHLSKEWNHPVYGLKKKADVEQYHSSSLPGRRNLSLATNTSRGTSIEAGDEAGSGECPFCREIHPIDTCKEAIRLSLQERREILKGRCFGCLEWGHWSRACHRRKSCGICLKKHPTILHDEGMLVNRKSRGEPGPEYHEEVNVRGVQVENQERSETTGPAIAVALVPVRIRLQGSEKDIVTYAAQDPYSTDTFIKEDLLKALGVDGAPTTVLLTTMAQKRSPIRAKTVVGLHISDLNNENTVSLPEVLAYKDLPVDREDIPTRDQVKSWPHLSNVPIQWSTASVGILIGMNVPSILRPLEVVYGKDNEPYALRTKLGWSIHGPVGNVARRKHKCNRIKINNEDVKDMIHKMYNQDVTDIVGASANGPSVDDREWLEKVEKSACLIDGHYFIDLPFRNPKIVLPNNKAQVLQRALALKRKLLRDPSYFEHYKSVMDELLTKGFMEAAVESIDGANTELFYIPHHGVYHPRKPEKLRVVFDCSATTNGISLNSTLLQGPDLANGLLGVLHRFRQEKVALVGDIEAMYHQVKVPEKDRDFLRLLWWPGGDLNKPLQEFRLTVHLFGAVSSPSCANFALQKTARDHASQFSSESVSTVLNAFYVDDLLKSVASVEVACSLQKELSDLCAKGGFKLTKFMSNNKEVMHAIPPDRRATSFGLKIKIESGVMERVLGVLWNVDQDCFEFSVVPKLDLSTRRKLLSAISSIYDPLGMVAPSVLLARQHFRNLTLFGNQNWDTPIPTEELINLNKWMQEAPKLANLSVPRCFKSPFFGTVVSCQLHHFCDASERGYAAVSYLRLEDLEGNVNVAFVSGKARVAPKKVVSIPRMELIAAVLSVKQNNHIRSGLEYEINGVIYWTDSVTVLKYIANRTKRFHTFVANRVELILESSSPDQWRFVPTSVNPADDGSRGVSFDHLINHSTWLSGPSFLRSSSEEWPVLPPIPELGVDDANVRKETKIIGTKVADKEASLIETVAKNCRSLQKLKGVIKLVFEAVSRFRKQERITQNDEKIEAVVFEMVQTEWFSEELNELKSNGQVQLSSKLSNLSPIIIDKLMRSGGRLLNAAAIDDFKFPIVLPKESRVSVLLVRDTHQKCGHLGREYVLSELRQRLWIIGASQLVRKEISMCVPCKKIKGKAIEQRMADLPPDRVKQALPFENTGVDYFGPFYVKRGRSQEKRYGVLFTCLCTRATHLEIASSLDSDSFINALRRFVARRGAVKILRSDNGTNFHGANRELKEQISKLQASQPDLAQYGIVWKFNAPGASHHGGVWERSIRTARQILQALLQKQQYALTEECLQTTFCEVEAIMNKRPLTTPSNDPNDLEALTPNHLLNLRGGEPHLLCEHTEFARSRWKQIQQIADSFWYRWKREYLSLLRSRKKWKGENENLEPNDLVLVMDNSTPRNQWLMGRVLQNLPGRDGRTRVAQIRTKSGVLVRPIAKLCLLSRSRETT